MTREEVLEKVNTVIQDVFDIKFAMKDVVGMKNVGQMVDLIMEQLD